MRVLEVLVIAASIMLLASAAAAFSMPFKMQGFSHHATLPSLNGAGNTFSTMPFGSTGSGSSLGSALHGMTMPSFGSAFKLPSMSHPSTGSSMSGFGKSMGTGFSSPFGSLSKSGGLSSLLAGFPMLRK